MNEPIQAAGTSEGVKKSWEHRIRQIHGDLERFHHAHFQESESSHTAAISNALKALREGRRATEKDDKSSHAKAAEYHNKSAESYSRAGNHTLAQKHWKAAAAHEGMVRHGYSTASESETNMNEPKDFILCQDVGVIIAASQPWEMDKPVNFQWMPAGVTTVCAHYGGKPIELTVNVTKATAAAVQASYEDWFRYRPKQAPFGCIEHREQEAAIRLPKDIAGFSWKDAEGDRDAGIYCTAVPTGLGAKNVTEGIHNSWSPSFTTDAAYDRAKVVKSASGRDFLIFPKGVRGSRENPAEVTGCAFSVGSLTNKPAFRNINPVRAVAEELYEPEQEAAPVQAMWSDAARDKALEARRKHAHEADLAADHMHAHAMSRDAFEATLDAHKYNTEQGHTSAEYRHREAARMHQRLTQNGEHSKAHTKAADEHREEAYKIADKVAKKAAKASEALTNDPLAAVYAAHAPKDEELQTIYAKLADPRTELEKLYDRLGEPDAEPAGRS